jgi:CubicO group peptidase (beta-lactamase class C family)
MIKIPSNNFGFLSLSACTLFLATALPVQADVDEKMLDRLTGRDFMISMGTGPTPINVFKPLDTIPLESGKSVNLDKFFNHKENLSAVVLKNGQLVYERYAKKGGFADKFPAHGMSMTKTAVGLVIGHLLCDGKIQTLDDTMGKYSPNLAKSIYNDIKIKDVLRMASGVNRDRKNERDYNQILRNRFEDGTNDSAAVIQSLKSTYIKPGKISSYHTLDATAVAVLANDIAGVSVDQIFFDKIYTKMHPEGKMIWWADKKGNSLGMAGLNMVTRDWARFGQYMVDEMRDGSCIGKYIEDGIKNSIKTNSRDYQKYGYFFWVSNFSGKEYVILTGNGGQVMVPNHYDNNVAVVLSASNFKYGKKHIITDTMAKVVKELRQNN